MKPLIKKSLKKWVILILIGILAYLLGYMGAQIQNIYYKVGTGSIENESKLLLIKNSLDNRRLRGASSRAMLINFQIATQ
ncbi:MAG: hypothetical protein JNM39_18110 [Bdellovibrionaceae bacterium]|nr:hypothetical protein [Pseudobdellovibrionaceae bacterium]